MDMDIPLSKEVTLYYHNNRKISAAWRNPPILTSTTLESKNYQLHKKLLQHEKRVPEIHRH